MWYNTIKKNINKLAIIIFICGIIIMCIKYIAYGSLGYWFKDINIDINIDENIDENMTVRIMPDSTAFHWYISEYNAIDRPEPYQVSLKGPMIEESEKRMKGYGKYHMQMQYNLGNFIEYCYEDTTFKNAIESVFQSEGGDDLNNLYINFRDTYSGQASYGEVVKQTLNNIWNAMINISGPAFETKQDEFIIRKYLLPAIEKMNISNEEYKEIFNENKNFDLSLADIDNFNGEEFMTALLSSVYSEFWTADMSNINARGINIGRANLVPFLYNVDETGTSGKDIAKYAYIAYIEGFLVAGRTDGFHYWEQEYKAVMGEDYEISDAEVERLRKKFDNAMDVLNVDGEQGDKGNRLLGSTIDEVIRSPYNVSTKLMQTKNIINDILEGIKVNTDYKDLIARNYLMVKHMMDNSYIDNTIKDYCAGVVFNESKFSQGQFNERNGNTALLSDFQLVECDKGWFNYKTDTDEDGLSDKDELGSQEKLDITAFVKKKAEHSGLGLYEKAKLWEIFNDMIEVKGDNNSNCKVYAKMYKYNSNPVLKDTDFDGIEDGDGEKKLWDSLPSGKKIDESPKESNFKGSIMTTRDGNLNIDFNIDFRNFLRNEELYSDELAQFGLIMSNLASGKRITLKQKNKTYGTMDITQYMTLLGFKEVENYEVYNENNIKVSCYIGYKSIDYYGKKRGVIGIFLNTNESVETYRQLVVEKENLHINSIYTEIARRLYSKVDIQKLKSLEDKYDLDYCYFVSGKGIAGGVASEVANIIRGNLRIDGSDSNKNIYCYTFGAPKTHTGYSNVNSFIKNIINEDDYLTKVVADNNGYRMGSIYNASIYSELIYNYKNLTKNKPKYTGNYMKINNIIKAVDSLVKNFGEERAELRDDIAEILSKYISKTSNKEDMSRTNLNVNKKVYATQITEQIRDSELKTASSVEAYWTLAKSLEGTDEKRRKGKEYKKTIDKASSEVWDSDNKSWLSVVKRMGEWYVDNVYTYNGGSYGAHRYKYPGEKDIDDENWYKKYESWGNVLYDAGSSPIYLAGNNGRVGQVKNKSNKNVKVNIEENEDLYQSEWKNKFEYQLKNSSDEARRKREEHFEETNKKHKTEDGSVVNKDTILEKGKDVDMYKMYELAFDDKDVKTRKQRGMEVVENQPTPEARLWYKCSEIKGSKVNKVRDDCASYIASVIYKYLNDVLKVNENDVEEDNYTYNPYMTSGNFSNDRYSNNSILRTIERWFDCYEGDSKGSKFSLEKAYPLQPGDILVRYGHVEIYLNPDLSFGWGQVHNSYENNPHAKAFRYHFGEEDEVDSNNTKKGYYFYNINDSKEGHYIKVYRLKKECEDYKSYTNSLGGIN